MRALLVASALLLVSATAAADEQEAQWHFEALSLDGKHALLRKLDAEMRSAFDVRVVEVGSGTVIDDAKLEELARVPASTIGGKPAELQQLDWMLVSHAFEEDIARGAAIASRFPFGACGRLAASPSAISFDAGDWLYVADTNGRVRQRLVDEAAYDPRFSPDGKWLFFRRATGHDKLFAHYEMFVSPADMSAPPKLIAGTAGMHDHFVSDGKNAYALSTQVGAETCFVSLALKPPFATKKLACVDGDERVVESVISPKGKWAAVVTRAHIAHDWHLRVLSLTTGKAIRDEAEAPGLALRAISDSGLLVESGSRGVVISDVNGTARLLEKPIDLGSRGYFKSDTELVYENEGSVSVLDLSSTFGSTCDARCTSLSASRPR
jgi:hypothetical protein